VRIRRYNELDPVRLAGLLDAVPAAEQPGVYRRLGDVALFLTGVFPDYTTTNAFGPVQVERLLRVATGPVDRSEHPGAAPAVDLLERLGTNWYRTASPRPAPPGSPWSPRSPRSPSASPTPAAC
jgi:hypothetical protein